MTSQPLPIFLTQQQQPVVTFSSGTITAIAGIGTSPVAALSANSLRSEITFHNPNTNSNANLLVYPNKDASGATLTPTFAAPAGGFVIFPASSLKVTGVESCGGAWSVLASAAGPSGLTISAK